MDGGVMEGIEETVAGSEAAKGIYDLQGRRIEKIQAPGLYIVDGKKKLVK